MLPLVLLAFATGAACWAGLRSVDLKVTWQFWTVMAWFPIVTGILLYWQEQVAGRTNVFIRRFIGGMVMKLMASLALFIILLKLAPDGVGKPFTIVFASLYLIYLLFSAARLARIMHSTGPHEAG